MRPEGHLSYGNANSNVLLAIEHFPFHVPDRERRLGTVEEYARPIFDLAYDGYLRVFIHTCHQ